MVLRLCRFLENENACHGTASVGEMEYAVTFTIKPKKLKRSEHSNLNARGLFMYVLSCVPLLESSIGVLATLCIAFNRHSRFLLLVP
jgi:hypothetical protein